MHSDLQANIEQNLANLNQLLKQKGEQEELNFSLSPNSRPSVFQTKNLIVAPPEESNEVLGVLSHYDNLIDKLRASHQSKVKELETRLNEECDAVINLKTKLEQANQKCQVYQEEVESYKDTADASNRKIKMLETENKRLKSDIGGFAERIREEEEKRRLAEKKLGDVERELNQAKSQSNQSISSAGLKEELDKILKTIERERQDMGDVLKKLDQNKEGLQQENEKLQDELKKVNEEKDSLAQSMKLQESNSYESEKLRIEKEGLLVRVKELESSLEERERELKEKNLRIEGINLELKDCKEKLQTILGMNEYLDRSLKQAEDFKTKVIHH